jgi:hypothetical protein
MEIYQDIYSRGKIKKSGIRTCSDRYEGLKFLFNKYNRPFSILDIGANFGYFSIRAAEEYNAISTMIQPAPQSTKILLDLCEENSHLNLITLNKRINGQELKELSKCERFDVVLALNVVHHIKEKNIIDIINSIRKLGTYIIFENPSDQDKGTCGKGTVKQINQYIEKFPHTILGEFSRHTDPNSKSKLILINGTNERISKAYFGSEAKLKSTIDIIISFDERKVMKSPSIRNYKNSKRYGIYDWIQGINLQTFIKLNGIYPKKLKLIKMVKEKNILGNYKWDDTHGDINPWNLILDGKNLHLIDLFGRDHKPKSILRTDKEGIESILQVLA